MFDKLKKRLIVINMSLLTMVFVLIFGTIYAVTAISSEKDLEHELRNTMSNPRKIVPNLSMKLNNIIIELDSNNNVAQVLSYIQLDETTLQDTILEIVNNKNNLGKIKIQESSYGYLKEYTNKGLKIVLINRQQSIDMLSNLLKIFISIGSISLILLLLISIYLTNKTIKPIKESFEKQKQFIADASHELKTPLTIISTNTSLILSDTNKTVESQSKWINYINNQVERMSKLIDEMLSLAKLDTNKELVEFASFNISKLIDNVLLTFEAVIFENNIEFSSNIEENITIKGDKESIKKVLNILLDNAIKYTNKNGKIDVEMYQDKNKIKLKVKNTGEGIKKEDLEKIFERFYRVDTSRARETGGYGLGLSIAKSIVDMHNGKIYAESNLGKDTTFSIEFNL